MRQSRHVNGSDNSTDLLEFRRFMFDLSYEYRIQYGEIAATAELHNMFMLVCYTIFLRLNVSYVKEHFYDISKRNRYDT